MRSPILYSQGERTKIRSPIKYYGGKSFMTDIIISYFPDKITHYIEGFGGGASILLSKEPSAVEVYNDLDKNVYSLFKVISDPVKLKQLKERLELTYFSADLRLEYKRLLKTELDIEDRAYYFFYVNRTSFQGTGGFSRQMEAKGSMAPAVSSYLSAVDRLVDIHNRLRTVVIENLDIFRLLELYNKPEYFIYLDPPYVKESRRTNQTYKEDFSNKDHSCLIEALLEHPAKILVSGYNHPLYQPLTERWGRFDFKQPGDKQGSAVESLWRNYNPGAEQLYLTL